MEAPYLTCHGLSASYGTHVLFQNLSFAVHPGERWGIVGPNGAGKSTLFKLIQETMKPLQGSISIRNGVRASFISQKIPFDENITVEQILRSALPVEYDTDFQIKKIENDLKKHEEAAEKNNSLYEDEKWLDKLSDLNVRLSEVAGTPTSNIIQSALKVGHMQEMADRPFRNLSGGQQKKVQIISAFLKNPNLILLDEPTNHLDVQTVDWLEEFLLQIAEKGFSLFGFQSQNQDVEPVSFVLISHDRALLDTLVNKILEVEDGQATQYEGNYEEYSQLKLQHILTEEKTRAKMANTMRRELEWLRSGTKARTTKQTARIERAHALDKALAAKEKKANLNKSTTLTFSAQMVDQQRNQDDVLVAQQRHLGQQELLVLKDVTIAHPVAHQDPKQTGSILFENLNLTIKPGSRIAILGPNGSGKSTLLAHIVQNQNPLKGEFKFHELCKISYFDQKRTHLDYQETVRKNIAAEGDHVYFSGKYIHIMSYLERFLFYKFDANRLVSELSGGEQARLLLAKMMLEQGNLLILDEPTNDLDIPTLQVLEKNLIDFNGGILFTSHDRYFMQRVATNVLTYLGKTNGHPKWDLFPDLNQALQHMESFQEDQRKREKESEKIKSDLLEKNLKNQIEHEKDTSKKRLSFKTQKEMESLEKKIMLLEEKIQDLSQKLEQSYLSGENHALSEKLVREVAECQVELDASYERWEEIAN